MASPQHRCKQVAGAANPHEVHRLELTDRLDAIEGLADGAAEKASRSEQCVERINRPKYALYVSPVGNDANPGTKESPFGTIGRAQAEVRRIRETTGLPEAGTW